MARRLIIVFVFAIGLLCSSGPGVESAGPLGAGPVSPVNEEKQTDTRGGKGDAQSEPAVLPLDSSLVFVPLDESGVLSRRFEENTARPLSAYLAVGADRFYGFERYELSKAQCALYGADSGVTLGLIAGALGMSAGLWDERTAWYIAGAAAVLGALRGASMADEPAFRVRLRWDDTDRQGPSR